MVRWIAAAAASGLLLAGCGTDDDAATTGAPATTASTATATVPLTYKPTSDVGANAAIGKDVAEIRALLEPAGGRETCSAIMPWRAPVLPRCARPGRATPS